MNCSGLFKLSLFITAFLFQIPVNAKEPDNLIPENIIIKWNDEALSTVNLSSGDIYDVSKTFTTSPADVEIYYEVADIDNAYAMTITEDGLIEVTDRKDFCKGNILIWPVANRNNRLTLQLYINKENIIPNTETEIQLEDIIDNFDDIFDTETEDVDYWRQIFLDEVAKIKLASTYNEDNEEEEFEWDEEEDKEDENTYETGYRVQIIENDDEEDEEYIKPLKKVKKIKINKKKRGSIQVKFANVKGADGYDIDISRRADFRTFTRYKVDDNKKLIKGLKRNKVYYIRVRAINNEIKGSFSKIKKTKTNKK